MRQLIIYKQEKGNYIIKKFPKDQNQIKGSN